MRESVKGYGFQGQGQIDAEQSEPEVYQWLDITANQNLGEHNRGIGVGDGALAIQLLHALNA